MAHTKTLLGIALGVAGTLAAPLALPAVIAGARPMLKGLVKHSLLGLALVREKLALALEELDDLLAEVNNEVSDELARRGPPPARSMKTEDPIVDGPPPSNGSGRADRPAAKVTAPRTAS